jgi:hypothetical protein
MIKQCDIMRPAKLKLLQTFLECENWKMSKDSESYRKFTSFKDMLSNIKKQT